MAEEEKFQESKEEEISEEDFESDIPEEENSQDDSKEISEEESEESEDPENASSEIATIKKEAYHEEGSFTVKEERDRLKQLLDETDFSINKNEESFGLESLEDIAISAPAFPGSSGEGSYENSESIYQENNVYQNTTYQAGGYNEVRNYEEMTQGQDPKTAAPQDPKIGKQVYTPKPVENFNQSKDTGLPLGADQEKKEAREKYRLR